LTQAAVSICGTIMLRFFFSMSVIMDGSVIICCCGFSFLLFWLNSPVACQQKLHGREGNAHVSERGARV
jgi:hypothetical protein